MRGVVVLGSTGSIGTQTLEVLRTLPEEFRVLGLSAGSNTALLERQVVELGARYYASTAPHEIDGACRVSLEELVALPGVDLIVVATSSTAALHATLCALEMGRAVATANKETLVAAGELVVATARRAGAPLLPIDSEHSAVWQCLRGEAREAVARIVLTASGGAFRDLPLEELHGVTAEQALKHPVWQMGTKVTIDTATLVNKAFEVIEARWLFDLSLDIIDVVIHRESVVHSIVHFVDGSSKAQLGRPDMRVPIQYALTYPARAPGPVKAPDLTALGHLTFAAVDERRYPAFPLVLAAARAGGTYPAALSAANDIAVEAFVAGRTPFGSIGDSLAASLDAHRVIQHPTLEEILDAERWGRAFAAERLTALL